MIELRFKIVMERDNPFLHLLWPKLDMLSSTYVLQYIFITIYNLKNQGLSIGFRKPGGMSTRSFFAQRKT